MGEEEQVRLPMDCGRQRKGGFMTSRRFLQLLAMLLCIALVPALLEAQGKGKGKGHGKGQEAGEDREAGDQGARGRAVFSERNRVIIHDYFRTNYSNLPPGLAKRGGNLPPGLQKH